MGAEGAEMLARVLTQCAALAHPISEVQLNNRIGDAGAQRLTESWSWPEGGLFLESEKWEDELEDEQSGEEDLEDQDDAEEGEDEDDQAED